MIEEYLQNPYVRASLIFLAVFLGVRLLIFIFQKLLPKFTKKTKTDLDDVLLEKTSLPITSIALLIGIRIGIGELRLDETFQVTLNSVWFTLMILVGSFLAYFVIDAIIVIGVSDLLQKRGSDKSLLQFFHSIIKISIFIGAFLWILSVWGFEIGPLLAGLGIAGLAIAFALQSTLENVFGGISILLDKSVKVGDLVYVDKDVGGKILKINLRSTKIRTFDNELIIVPNGKLASSNIQNVALPEKKTRVVVDFGVAYGSNIEKVKKIVLKELKKIDRILDEPEPVVRFLEMADSSLNFKAYFYVETFDIRLDAKDQANTLIYNALNKNKIEIPFPQMDVHMDKLK